jgi:hypothetical protein
MKNNVDSIRMLPSGREKMPGGANDEPTQQKGIMGNHPPRYLKASKAEKQKILDEFIASTGYHRKYAIRILRHGYPRGQHKRRGKSQSIVGKWWWH